MKPIGGSALILGWRGTAIGILEMSTFPSVVVGIVVGGVEGSEVEKVVMLLVSMEGMEVVVSGEGVVVLK